MLFRRFYFLFIVLISCSNTGKEEHGNVTADQEVGGRCEGCEAIYECPVSFDRLNNTDTLPDFKRPGPRLLIKGTVYQQDGETVGEGVVIYAYHTNQKGVYEGKEESEGWERRHGILRGWVKTDKDGEYRFYTLRPASYPNTETPQHVHLIVKEKNLNEYWISSIHFSDDPFFKENDHAGNRGGSGVVTPEYTDQYQIVRRDIILGKNVPGYPD